MNRCQFIHILKIKKILKATNFWANQNLISFSSLFNLNRYFITRLDQNRIIFLTYDVISWFIRPVIRSKNKKKKTKAKWSSNRIKRKWFIIGRKKKFFFFDHFNLFIDYWTVPWAKWVFAYLSNAKKKIDQCDWHFI